MTLAGSTSLYLAWEGPQLSSWVMGSSSGPQQWTVLYSLLLYSPLPCLVLTFLYTSSLGPQHSIVLYRRLNYSPLLCPVFNCPHTTSSGSLHLIDSDVPICASASTVPYPTSLCPLHWTVLYRPLNKQQSSYHKFSVPCPQPSPMLLPWVHYSDLFSTVL